MTPKRSTLIATAVALLILSSVGESLGAAASSLTRAHSGGGVTVKVTYLNPQDTDDVRFQVVLDTHSVNLDGYDLNALSLLRDDSGTNYKATSIYNKGAGHHREIILTFPRSSSETKRLELLIKEIGGVKERSFQWDLQAP